MSTRDAVLRRLVPSVVHRLNNSLVVSGGFLELFAANERAPDGRARQGLEEARQETAQAARILRHLSGYARDHPPRPEPVSLVEPVAGALVLLEALAKEGKVRFEPELEATGVVAVCCPRSLEQLLITLVGYEVLAPLDGAAPELRLGRVRLRVAGGARAAVFVTHDLGRAPFPHDAAARRHYDALCALCRRLGARLRVRSFAGRPTCLRVSLEAVPGVGDAEPARRRERHPRLLLLQTERQQGQLIASVLREAGYRVDVARDEAEAQAALGPARELVLLQAGPGPPAPRLLELARACASPLVLIGGQGPGGREPILPEPIRPDALLDFVRARLLETPR